MKSSVWKNSFWLEKKEQYQLNELRKEGCNEKGGERGGEGNLEEKEEKKNEYERLLLEKELWKMKEHQQGLENLLTFLP